MKINRKNKSLLFIRMKNGIRKADAHICSDTIKLIKKTVKHQLTNPTKVDLF